MLFAPFLSPFTRSKKKRRVEDGEEEDAPPNIMTEQVTSAGNETDCDRSLYRK